MIKKATDFEVGDLITITNDSYIFTQDKAFMIHKGSTAVVIEIIDDAGPPLEVFSQGRRRIWKGSVKIRDEHGRNGWIHAANIEKINL